MAGPSALILCHFSLFLQNAIELFQYSAIWLEEKNLKIAQSSLGRVNADPQRPPQRSQSHLGDWPDPAQDLDFLLRVRR